MLAWWRQAFAHCCLPDILLLQAGVEIHELFALNEVIICRKICSLLLFAFLARERKGKKRKQQNILSCKRIRICGARVCGALVSDSRNALELS